MTEQASRRTPTRRLTREQIEGCRTCYAELNIALHKSEIEALCDMALESLAPSEIGTSKLSDGEIIRIACKHRAKYPYPTSSEPIEAAIKEALALSSPSAIETITPLEQFAIAILESSREHYAADVDGGEIQDTAEKLGVLVPVEADGPCGADCTCAEFGDFPQTCYRYSPEVQALLARSDRGDQHG